MGCNFKKTVAVFEINAFEIVKMQSFILKGKKLNLGTKLPYFGIFGLKFGKTIVIFEISAFDICYNAKFHVKEKK